MGIIDNGVLVAIIAHGLIGASLVWDKVLLRQPETQNLLSYVFWLGSLSVLGLILVPFGFRTPEPGVAALGFLAGFLHLVAIWFYYAALAGGEASQTLAIMGGFSPLATALIAMPLLGQFFGRGRDLAFFLLVAGGFAMFLSERLGPAVIPPVLLASGLFGLVNVLQKMVFDSTNFVTGYVLFTFGTFFAAVALLVRASWREQIFATSEKASPRSRFWYFVNRFASGVGSFLIFYAISLENPAIVDAITAVRYLIIFFGALLLTKLRPDWLHELFSGWGLFWKIVSTMLVAAGLVLLGLGSGGQGTGIPN